MLLIICCLIWLTPNSGIVQYWLGGFNKLGVWKIQQKKLSGGVGINGGSFCLFWFKWWKFTKNSHDCERTINRSVHRKNKCFKKIIITNLTLVKSSYKSDKCLYKPWRRVTLLKRDPNTGPFLWIFRIFFYKNTFFYRAPPDDCFWLIRMLNERAMLW